MPVITVDGLTKRYGDFEAVRGISFEVYEGEVFALLGPNGAGKTTTTEILEGYRERTGGTVDVLGFDPQRGGRAMRERIGIVLQSVGLDPYLSVHETVASTAVLYPNARDVDEVLDVVGLTEKAGDRVKRLSGGQLRRLDLALGLVGDPELIFLDEPTTGFDPSARRDAWDLVAGLTKLGKTVLLTTHFMDEAQYLAHRVAVLAGGRIVATGTPDSLGGRQTAGARVRFEPPGIPLPDLGTPGTGPDEQGYVTFVTEHPTRLLARLTGWAAGQGVELVGLTVARPSLEDIYLELTQDES